jgi:hypothetical protein
MQQVQLPEHACCNCTHPAGRTMTNAPTGAAAAELEATSDAVLHVRPDSLTLKMRC